MKVGDLIKRIRCDTDIRRASRDYKIGLVLEVIEGRRKGKVKMYARVLWNTGYHDVWAANCLETINES
tara:strand:+ start:276 stop:479 length:204 start_codon:yes stop_codon:yes gene_type:complete